MKFIGLLVAGFATLATVFALCPSAPAQNKTDDAKLWTNTVDKAIAYLKSSQDAKGGWSTDNNPGVTGVALTGLLKTKRVTPNDPVAKKALDYIESLINVEKGHIAGKDPKVQLQNYVTSINLMALVEANNDKYKAVIADAVKFLKKLQWDEEEGKKFEDDYYGGAGYDTKSRPDLSNTQMFLDALHAAGIPKDDPAMKKAMIFVSRCQNLPTEANNRPWAGKISDGSFIYTASDGGVTKVNDDGPDKGLPGYGSMTYAGIKSLIYCGVSKDDQRVKKAYEWIQNNYSVDKNPGMPEARAEWGLYYYYHTMAKCLDVMGVDEVVDAKGVKHNWRSDIIGALAKRQQKDGSFVNNKQWMEADPNLTTGYALMALSYCRPAALNSK
ncbi:MAG TPA: prenyltransferase/squalene oxidase repeat-containing protein [Gemmataceae bacterium]|nr:prenyltransferase/squalene oxidase repeat-containing protein [Gemmataceae bacterium]